MEDIKEKTADEMFDNIGYFANTIKDYAITYYSNSEKIVFYTEVKTVAKYRRDSEELVPITVQELQAINKKCKELRMDEIKKNKVYFAQGDEDYGGIYIAAKTSKEAKSIALGKWVAETVYNPFIELRVTRCWSVKETEYEGELDISQINELGLAWWSCDNCDKEDFEIIDGETYRCKNCSEEFKIPYVNG